MEYVLGFITVSMLVFVTPGPTRAQTPPPVTDCDRYATRELMRDGVAPDIIFEKIEPHLALPACESAAERYPDSSRLLYELARVKSRAGQVASAVGLLKALSATDYPPAQHALGVSYTTGEGVEQSDDLAFLWFRKSAEGEDAYGQFNLGFMYEKGYGTQKDLELAKMWYGKSADQGFSKAKEKLVAIGDIETSSPLGGKGQQTSPLPSSSKVTARGQGLIPGALICPDYSTASMIYDLYAAHWEEAMQDKFTNGASRLIRGPASQLPDLQAFRCTLIPVGTPMILEGKEPVPVVVAKTANGQIVRGVTLHGMVSDR